MEKRFKKVVTNPDAGRKRTKGMLRQERKIRLKEKYSASR